MNPSECIVQKLALIMVENPSLKAVRLDVDSKKISFASKPGPGGDATQSALGILSKEAFLDHCQVDWGKACEDCLSGGQLHMPKGIKLVHQPGHAVLLEKVSCPTAPRFWKWNQIPWIRLQPRTLHPADLLDSDYVQALYFAVACGVFTVLGYLFEASGFHAGWYLTAYVGAYIAGIRHPIGDVVELLRKRVVDIHFLMICVALGAAFIGHWREGAILLFLFSLSGALEELALARTEREIQGLFKEAPKEAWVLDESGEEILRPVDSLSPGMRICIKPGQMVPVDALLQQGNTSVNESNLTGESLPVDKAPGDRLYAGSLNTWGSVRCEVLKSAGESALSKIIQLIRDARDSKAPAQQLTDRFSGAYTYSILGLSFTMFLVWWLVLDYPAFKSSHSGTASAFYRSMTLLVVASPCALVLSIPSAILAGIAAGARSGILFRGGVAIENLAQVNRVAMDKTGTLTEGDLRVVGIDSSPGLTGTNVLQWAASLCSQSLHPVSEAILRKAKEDGINLSTIQGFKSIDGMGLEGTGDEPLDGGQVKVRLGRRTWISQTDWVRSIPLPAPGLTETFLQVGDRFGRILLQDTLRVESAPLLDRLRRRGLKLSILTGDRMETAGVIAANLGEVDIRAELSPEAKVLSIREWKANGESVAMIGDGVNDAASLAAADVGIAMGMRGSDSALEQADVVLMKDRLEKFHDALELSCFARRIIRQNLVVSLGVIAVLVAGALGAALPLTIGVIGHEGSTLVVVFNSLRLLFFKSKEPA